jgi:hypothetical protein
MNTTTKLLTAVIGAVIGVAASQTPTPGDIRGRLDAYLATYERTLSALVAREQMTQTINGPAAPGQFRVSSPTTPQQRRLDSDVAFISLPGDIGWMGIRVVRRVNGETVDANADALATLLRTEQPYELAKQLLAESARYNLGSARNTNLPNLPLELLHPRHRDQFSYTIAGREVIDRVNVTVLTAEEIGIPTVIWMPDGTNLISRVTAFVDDRGRLLRAEVRSRFPAARGIHDQPVVRVDFKRHDGLDLLVPVEMREQFTTAVQGEMGTSVARYSDFRRFETSARIVPQ